MLNTMRNIMKDTNNAATGALIGGLCLSIAASVCTAEVKRLEEIVVTAQKRGEQLIQDTPISIDAVTGDTIQKMNATGIQDLARSISGLSVLDWGSNKKKLKIRGVSSSTFDEPQETVAVYLDDIPITGNGGTDNENGASPDIALFDLERIEVLKGPQSTLYGASAMGGTVRYIMNKPQMDSFDAKIGMGVSSVSKGDSSWTGDVMVNAPLADNFALRFVGQYRDEGGYIDNIVSTGYANETRQAPQQDVNTSEVSAVTLSGLWQVSDEFSLLARYLHQDYDVDAQGTSNYSTANLLGEQVPELLDQEDPQQLKYVEEFGFSELRVASLTAEWETDYFTVTSATSYLTREVDDLVDETRALIVFFGAEPGGVVGGLNNVNESDQFVEELRISSNDDGPLQWVVGAYYYKIDKIYTQQDTAPGLDDLLTSQGIPPSQFFGTPTPDSVFYGVTDLELTQLALFGEVSYELNDAWELTLGARWFEVEQDRERFASGIVNNGVSIDPPTSSTETDVNPKVSLAYRVNDDTLIYASAAKGYRNGGFSQFVSPFACGQDLAEKGYPDGAPTTFESDSLWNYELGLKTTFADSRVQLNAAIYHIDWDDIQTGVILDCGFTFFDNLGKAEVDGVELSLLAQATDNLLLSLNLGYVDSRLAEDNTLLGIPSGATTPGISDITISTSADYDFSLLGRPGSIRLDYSYSSSANQSYFGESDPINRRLNGFGLFNTNLSFSITEQFNLSFYGKNLADKRGVAGAQVGLFNDDLYLVRPREFGLKAVYQL